MTDTTVKIIARLRNAGGKYYLRNTIWTSEISRADVFESIDDARAAINKAAKFMRKSDVKRVEYVDTRDVFVTV